MRRPFDRALNYLFANFSRHKTGSMRFFKLLVAGITLTSLTFLAQAQRRMPGRGQILTAESAPPAGSQPHPTAEDLDIRVWTVWYADFQTCQSAGTGSITSPQGQAPQHGTLAVQTGDVELPPGFPCAGQSLPATTAYYTWTDENATTLFDSFDMHYASDDGTQAADKEVSLEKTGENLGIVKTRPGGCSTCSNVDPGDPIDLATGNVFEQVKDYETAGQNKLSFARYYNSLAVPNTYASELGVNWRSNYDGYINTLSSGVVEVERPDGQAIIFRLVSGKWTPRSDVNFALTNSGATWTLTNTTSGTVETYGVDTGSIVLPGLSIVIKAAFLNTIKLRNGYLQTLAYEGGKLYSVTDSYGRKLEFTYENGALHTVTTPDDLVITFTYNVIVLADGNHNQLSSVSYSTDPATSQQYAYTQSGLPQALTGITDENGNAFASWSYDGFYRGASSQFGPGAEATSITYNDTDGSRTLTNALGQEETYEFTVLQGTPKITRIARIANTQVPAAYRTFTYDGNGYQASQTDWNGHKTTYVNSTIGLPTTINEAVGTAQARTTTITYSSSFPDLPVSIVTPGLTTTFNYDTKGEVLTKTLTDTTTTTAPYPTKGEARTWTNTWSDGLLTSVKTPNGYTTTNGYDSTGALTSITDPYKQEIKITSHTGGGLPKIIVDPNGVTTTLTYSARQWKTGSTISGTGGTYRTTWEYDAAGNLIKTTLPDNSYLANVYDTAHRLISVTDALGNYITYTLDGLGDRTQTNVYKSSGVQTRTRSDSFDPLGRLLIDTAGAGQTTTWTYDGNGNALSVTDGLKHKTTNAYDSLNRLIRSVAANGAATTPAYDTHDFVTSVKDANGNTTSYLRSGFEDVIEQLSPDSGETVFYYDKDANLTSKIDALGIVSNQTFDALDRRLTTTYPADSSKNVAYTYDQTGTGFTFGIGRLTSVKDAAGSLTRAYDERGNLASEKRVNSKTTLTTSYKYDGASRVASITYPDGTLVENRRDVAGYLTSVIALPSGSTTTTILATLSHLPFGPIDAAAYGNKVAEIWTYDQDYRATSIVDTLSAKNIESLSYAYDAANNVDTITDAVNAANTQTLGYDVVNRLVSAASGTGGYGSYGWTYDLVGNRLRQTQGKTTTTYDYTTGTNRLASITAAGVATTVTTNADGNITSIPPANSSSPATFKYSVANRLASVTGSPVAATFLYDYAGQRFSKTDSGSSPTIFSYMQGGTLIAENDNGHVADYIYADGRPIAVFHPGATPTADQMNYILVDHLGTPQIAFNSSGATVWQTTYQPFGMTVNVTASITQNLRFPGQYADTETGFNYNLNRDYMPNLGRYLETDPVGQTGGVNTYIYVYANPGNYTDILGLCESWDVPCQNAMRSAGLPQWAEPDEPVNPKVAACEMAAGAPCKLILKYCPNPFWKWTAFGVCEIGTTAACPLIFDDKKDNTSSTPIPPSKPLQTPITHQ